MGAIALLAGIGLTIGAVMLAGAWSVAPAVQPMSFPILPAAAQPFWLNPVDRNLAVAPDSKHVCMSGSPAPVSRS